MRIVARLAPLDQKEVSKGSFEGLASAMVAAASAKTPTEAFMIFANWVPSDRFPFISCVELKDESNVIATNFPRSWEEEYAPGQYDLHDPVNMLVARRTAAFRWREAKAFARTFGRRSQALRVMDAASDHGLVEGLVFPFHGPQGYRSCISLSGPRDAEDLAEEEGTFLSVLAWAVQTRLSGLHLTKTATPKLALTEREMTCLNLVGMGKTDADIATILGISTGTAHEYVSNAMRKLNANTRTHAYAKAVAAGILTPMPLA